MTKVVYTDRIFALQERGGISRYVCELASRVDGQHDFESRVVAPLHFNEHLHEGKVSRRGTYFRLRSWRTARCYQAVNRCLSPALVRTERPDLVHHSYYAPDDFSSASVNVVTVHDMIHEQFASQFPADDPTRRDKKKCVERADHILCVSHSTAADLTRLLGVRREKITITPLGLSDTFSCPAPRGERSPLERPYLLYVGHRSRYKNFRTALEAYAASGRLQAEFDFVVFGGFEISGEERRWIDGLGLRPGAVVRLEGDDAELARAYRHARVFVYPSLYEGFGIPPLEAMSAKCAVVCSDNSSIPEVVGNAALLFDACDADSMRDAMERACFDNETRARLVSAGVERAAAFSWQRCAADTLGAYRKLLGVASPGPRPA